MTIKIIDSEFTSPHLPLLHQWFEDEWGGDSFFITTRFEHVIPAPLMAIHNEQLIGGLAFTRYKSPLDEQVALWVNAIWMLPEWRGKAAASDLIKTAVGTAQSMGQRHIFALTDIPKLYIKNGWSTHTADKQEHIMWLKL